jgi:hypothetical protein
MNKTIKVSSTLKDVRKVVLEILSAGKICNRNLSSTCSKYAEEYLAMEKNVRKMKKSGLNSLRDNLFENIRFFICDVVRLVRFKEYEILKLIESEILKPEDFALALNDISYAVKDDFVVKLIRFAKPSVGCQLVMHLSNTKMLQEIAKKDSGYHKKVQEMAEKYIYAIGRHFTPNVIIKSLDGGEFGTEFALGMNEDDEICVVIGKTDELSNKRHHFLSQKQKSSHGRFWDTKLRYPQMGAVEVWNNLVVMKSIPKYGSCNMWLVSACHEYILRSFEKILETKEIALKVK